MGTEGCDDQNTTTGDGCSACVVDPGFTCSGAPSTCVTTCGDGVRAGTEACDDGNTLPGDGCTPTCTLPTGENCAQPLWHTQASPTPSGYQWTLTSGMVTTADSPFACDPNGTGPDVVIHYVKTSGTLAQGGRLLHVFATPTSTTTGDYLDVEITSGACDTPTELKCLWYKHDWDSYLDVPAGDYFVWVAKNSTGTFPPGLVIVDEVAAAAAEGEGCFMPYTTSSSIYTPPAMAGAPHTWTLPATINSFDMGPRWGEPGSISCDNTPSYGDIEGVDAVIEFNKTSATSVLQVDVQNNAPVLTTSDLDVEVLNVCDPTLGSKQSLACDANKDTITLAAGGMAGNVYIWVSTEATSEPFDGATVQVTELFPGLGESRFTPEILTGSASIVPTSTKRLGAPSCFPATGNVHWYAYTTTGVGVNIKPNAAGAIAVLDANGNELGCSTDATAWGMPSVGQVGRTVYIAVPVGGTVSALSITGFSYAGSGGKEVPVSITWPSSSTTDYGMAVSSSTIYLGSTSKLFEAPLAGGTATERGTADGITTTHLGYALTFANGSLFSADTTTTTTASRLFRIYDGTAMTWGPTTWDTPPPYAASLAFYSIATDGAGTLILAGRNTTRADFYQVGAGAPGTPMLLGSTTAINTVSGVAADATYLYVVANSPSGEGVFRLQRGNIAAAPVQLAPIDASTIINGICLDNPASPQTLYARAYGGDTNAIASPAGATPQWAGVINTLGSTADYGFACSPSGVPYLYETETDSAGRIVWLQ